jgi:diguanylate cyclase (GGDEF)-like protein
VELALPHVVVRTCGPGVGPDLVASLSVHPVEVSEARDVWELQRVSDGRPALLAVVVDPADAGVASAETRDAFPGVPILLVSDSAASSGSGKARSADGVDTIRASQPLQDICWLVLEAAARAGRRPGLTERPLGPDTVEVDGRGIVLAVAAGRVGVVGVGCRLRPGDSLLSVVEPLERPGLARAIARASGHGAEFRVVRLCDESGRHHMVSVGMCSLAADRIGVIVQPLICGGPVVGRHVNDRDAITGLLTRWAMSRALEARERERSLPEDSAVILLTLDEFTASSCSIGHRQTDVVLVAVASVLNQLFPAPALTSRLMGDSFLAYMPAAGGDESRRRAERLLRALGGIEVAGFTPRFTLRGSIGVAGLTNGDHDLAVRLAEAAAGEAHAAGGNRVIVAGSAEFTRARADELTAIMERGSWEVWLQPVVRLPEGRADYHEALARFDCLRRIASRADFFTAGRARGLLERFDLMMLQRVLEMLAAHPHARLGMNVSHETFMSPAFPAAFLDRIRRVPDGCRRLTLEIASRCMAAAEDVVGSRLESLAAAGVAVAIDDFGSGICRLRYLTQWPLAIVKLDQVATGYIDDDPLQRDFVRTVVSLCRARGITTVAEYTRSEEQLARLVADGVDLFQGERFGMPRPAADVLALPAVAAAHA